MAQCLKYLVIGMVNPIYLWGDQQLDATVNQVGTIKVCTINVNTLLLHKVDILCWYIQRHKIDVCFLIDVGLTVMESSYRVKEFKQRLGHFLS